MHRYVLLGAALLATTSCIPPEAGRQASRAPSPALKPAPLLRALALDIPDDILREADTDSTNTHARSFTATPSLKAAPPFLEAAQTTDDARRALDCLTAAVYYEARSESVDGQRAVAQVVLNRVRDRAFPHSVCGVVYQGAARRTGCQFSFTCDGSMLRRRDPAAWIRAGIVAQHALGGSVYEPVGPATFYHASFMLPWWASSMDRLGAVGAHIFYGWRGAMARALTFRQHYAGLEPTPAAPATRYAVTSGDEAAETTSAPGVTIHRGGTAPASGRTMISSGIRIHLGRDLSGHAVAPTDSGIATIGPETEEI